MQTKNIAVVGAIGLVATAMGGVLLWSNTDRNGSQNADGERLAMNHADPKPDFFTEPATVTPEPATRTIDTAGRGNQNRDAGMWGQFSSRLEEFDVDGDGILSDEERDTMMRAIRDEMRSKMDLDGDGEISREERMEARKQMFEQSRRGQELMRQFDADGNGVLDATEQAAMDAHMQAEREQRRLDQLARWDADGDGQISREERQTQREQMGSQRDSNMQDMIDEFDRDGDGQLSIEETQEAWATMQERREIDRFVSQYDRDGNGSMGASDYDAFLSDYTRGDMRADVNRDGVINSADVTAYTDMVTRSRNRP